MNRRKIVFMGTGPFALACLAALCETAGDWDVVAVYTKAPKKAGRGMLLKDGAVADYARARGIPLCQPLTLRDEEAQAAFDKATAEFDGNDLEPMALLATQVVAGTNYAILCHSELVTAEPVESIQVVIVYEDLEGNATISGISNLDIR